MFFTCDVVPHLENGCFWAIHFVPDTTAYRVQVHSSSVRENVFKSLLFMENIRISTGSLNSSFFPTDALQHVKNGVEFSRTDIRSQ